MPTERVQTLEQATDAPGGQLRRFVQLSLDLFGFGAVGPPAHAPQATTQSPGSQTRPRQRRSRTVLQGPEFAGPAPLRHPASSREIRLEGSLVGYEFKRGKRRTIGMQVGVLGLEVRAPRWVGQAEVDEALRERAAWIMRKLAEACELGQRQRTNRIEWRDGASVPYLGEPLIVVLDPRHGYDGAGAALQVDHSTLPGVARATLHVGLPHNAAAAQVRDAVQAWLIRAARELFDARLTHFAQRLGVQWLRLSLSSADTRWGSAGADGSIRLNWRLIHLRPELIDYVVVHELSHLRVMDHSERFWRTVQGVLPDYPSLRAELRAGELPPW